MKKTINPATHLFLYLSLGLCLTACDKNGKDDTPSPDNPAEAACQLTKIADAKGNDYTEIAYNTQGYATKLLNREVGLNDTGDYTMLSYNANNQLVKAEEYEDGQLAYYNTFKYTDGLLTTIRSYDQFGTADGVITLKYDSNKQMIEQSDNGNYKGAYTYDNKGNLTKEEHFIGGSLFYRETYENYDNKRTPFSAIQSLPNIYTDSFSKNNPGKSTTYVDSNADGNIHPDESETVTYTYTYNSNGFPTQVTETDANGDTEVTTLTYQCK